MCLAGKIIGIDTEFSRDKTYRPILSLVQIAHDNKDIELYDVLDINCKKEELRKILSDDSIVKVIHSARQDVEVIYHYFGFTIQNIFDTQIAAKYLGYGNEISYTNLINQILSLSTPIVKTKKLQYSQWLKRPLSPEQTNYAKQDVFYLHDMYQFMLPKILQESITMQNKLYNEMKMLSDIKRYQFNSLAGWQKVNTRFATCTKSKKQFAKDVFILREKIASALNIPKERVIQTAALIEFILTSNVSMLDNKLHKRVNKKEFINLIKRYESI